MNSLKICPHCGAEYESDQRFRPQGGTTLRLQNGSGDLVGSIVADRYHALRKLGEGGRRQGRRHPAPGPCHAARRSTLDRRSKWERRDGGGSGAGGGRGEGGRGGAVLIGVLVTAILVRRDGSKSGRPVNVTTRGSSPSDMRSPRDTTRYAGRIDTSAADAQRGADPEVYRGGVVDGSTTLDWLENVASGDMTSEATGDIVRALDQMRGRIGGNDRRVHAAISEALAESSRNPRSAACAALRRIQSIAPSTSRARQVERTMMLAC